MSSQYMAEALALAKQGLGRTSPNPAVGAVVVRDEQVVGAGYHTYAARKHAEIVALEQAGDRARGATLYITLEPCSHQGRTGPCAEKVVAAGIRRVVAAMEDPNPLVAGQGFERLRGAGIDVEIAGEWTRDAAGLNEAFIHFMRTGRPLVTLKSALTLDGKISAPDDNLGWITSSRARQHVQELRHHTDAILTGIGTALADDCRLTDRTGRERSRPLLRIVMDSQLRLPVTSKLAQGCQDDLVVVSTSVAPPERREALQRCGVKVLAFDGPRGRCDFPSVVKYLASEKYLSLMIEAGSKINWAALESGVVDKIFFYYAPKILGGLQSLPVVGGTGRRRRSDAIRFHQVKLHSIPPDEFAVEAYLVKEN